MVHIEYPHQIGICIIEIVDLCGDHESFFTFCYSKISTSRSQVCTLIPRGFVRFRHSKTGAERATTPTTDWMKA